jgi:hypothetical protein
VQLLLGLIKVTLFHVRESTEGGREGGKEGGREG